MQPKLLRIATRKSPLALWQADHIAKMLSHHHPFLDIELVKMTTSGDRFLKDKLLEVGGKGLFVKELEEALLNNQADLAVHSMKDMPHTCPQKLMIAAIGKRENPYDAFVSTKYSSLEDLPLGAIIGTSSLRRQSQLLAVRPDLKMTDLRGNIHTRLEKMANEKYDAIILAVAGLKRMSLEHHIKEILPAHIMLPACGQGALGLECREDDDWVRSLLTPIHDEQTAICVQTERHVNGLLGGNCHVPLAVYAKLVQPTELLLQARVASADGCILLKTEQRGSIKQTERIANQSVEHLIAQGAKKLLHLLT